MKQLKIKDNSTVGKEYFTEISTVAKCIADKTFEQLDREGIFVFPEMIAETEDITKEQMILQSVNDFYRSGNIMGYIGKGNERLVITTRFSGTDNDFLFQYLLERVMDFPNFVDLETDVNSENRLFNLLIVLFPYYLRKAARKGIFKTYIQNSYNDINVKGTIDIPRHIKQNTPFVGKIAYNQREYSKDNFLMELIRHTIEFLKKKTYGSKILNQIKDEVKLIVETTGAYNPCDKRKIIELNKKNMVRHAFYQEYRALQQLCILILQNEKQQIGMGTQRIYGILFDGAWLWEEYINLLVKDIFYHPMNKHKAGVQYLFADKKGKIYPDFISKDSRKRIIADAKYKPMDNIGNQDYLQLLAYMFRFDASSGLYFYPEVNDKNSLKLMVNKGVSYEKNVEPREEVSIKKYGLKIPGSSGNYSDFVSKMKKNEEVFRNGILEYY